jgi:hypothetical protein
VRIDKTLLFALILLVGSGAHASDKYFAQASAGGNTGADCADARAVSSLVAGDWVAGNTLHLCGTISNTISALGSGSAGNPITIKFEAGSSIQMAALPTGGGIVLRSLQNIIVDGGGGPCGFSYPTNSPCSVGQIESTANGTGLANQIASVAIDASGSSGVEIRGLHCGPIYLHTSTSDLTQSPPGPICVKFVNASNISIHNNTINDCAWCLNGNAATASINNNEIYNNDHGVGIGGANSAINIFYNHFHDWVKWDTTNNSLHHDGVHFFDQSGQLFNSANVYGNLFDGDQGNNVTGAIYIEHASNGTIQNINTYDNVVVAAAGRFSGVGWIGYWNTAGGGNGFGSTGLIASNSIYGQFVGGSCLGVQGWNSVSRKDNLLVNCQNLIGVTNLTTDGSSDYNGYENLTSDKSCGSGCNTFTSPLHSNFSSFSQWQSDCACDAHGLFDTLAHFNLNSSTAQLQAGSTAIGAGTNLTSLGIASLNSDITGALRSPSAPWDMGAFAFIVLPATPRSASERVIVVQ